MEEDLVASWERRALGLGGNPDWPAQDNARAQRWAQEDLDWALGEAPVLEQRDLSRYLPAAPKPDIPEDETLCFVLPGSSLVPNWIEETICPGVFGVDVRCIIGPPRKILERHPGLFHLHSANSYKPVYHPEGDTAPMLYMAPAEPLKPGQWLIRYLGAAFSKTNDRILRGTTRLRGVRSGGPHAVIWLEDGDDALQYAYPAQPLFRPQSPKPEFGPDRVVSLHLSKGERVPDWIEVTTHPGVFGVDVLCVIGVPRMILERHPGLFPDDRVRDSNGAEILELVLCLAPVRPLAPGDCLIRYLGAAINWQRTTFLINGRGPNVWPLCGPDVIRWLNEGNDSLYQAHPQRLAIATGPKTPLDPVRELRLSKGERVPDWIEEREVPGVFGVDVLCLSGTPKAILDRHPGLFRFGDRRDWNKEDRRDGDPMLYLAPVEPLKPGECLIRYPSAAFSKSGVLDFRVRPRCWSVRSGGPQALVWLEEGEDALHHAVPLRPRFPPQQERPTIPAGEVCYLDFRKGEKVPDWVEATSHPGVFEVDVCCIIGPPRMILDRHPGQFRHACDYSSEDFPDPILYLGPVEQLAPGQGMVRYLGAAIRGNGYRVFRRESLWDDIWETGEAVFRLDEGCDVLVYVDPIEQV